MTAVSGIPRGSDRIAGLLIYTVTVVGLYLGVCAFVLATLIMPERRQTEPTPTELGFVDAEPVSFPSQTDQLVLRGWLVPSGGERAVILVHGIHSDAWDCQTPDIARAYVAAGFTVLLFDLRAHGRSDGERIGLGLLERGDIRAAVTLLKQRGFSGGKIGIHGTSYGAATAILATEEIPAIGAVVADSAFADIGDVIDGELRRQTGLPATVARVLMPGMDWLAKRLYSVRLDRAVPERAISGIAPRPILLIHGLRDTVIPFEHARRLKAAAGAAAELWAIPGEHTQGVRMTPRCSEPAPIRAAFLSKVVGFFERNLR